MFQHSVISPVKREVAWRFWSNVENWARVDPGVEFVKLDGPFAAGTKGTTKPVGQGPTEWQLIEVDPERRATIDITLPGAVVRFQWVFAETSDGGTRMTQTISVTGERAEEYRQGMTGLEENVPAGMQRIADAITSSA